MNRMQRLALSLVLLVALAAAPTMLAAAKELGSITISGPGINGEVTLSDPQSLMKLQQMGFFDTSTLVKAPQNLGEGYHLTGYLNLDGKVVPFVQAIYYPAAEGQTGYMHFTGGLNGDTMQTTTVDRWGTVTPAAGAVFRELASSPQKVALQIAVPAAVANAPAEQSANKASTAAVPALGGVLLLVVGAVWMLKRRESKARKGHSN